MVNRSSPSSEQALEQFHSRLPLIIAAGFGTVLDYLQRIWSKIVFSMALRVENRAPVHPGPKWYVRFIMVSFRTVLFTILFTALGMGVGLLLGIIATVVLAAVHHVQPDMANAYRHVAAPLALASGSCALAWNVFRGVKDAVSARTNKPVDGGDTDPQR
jgi:Flp pilus assembly pilin Flp